MEHDDKRHGEMGCLGVLRASCRCRPLLRRCEVAVPGCDDIPRDKNGHGIEEGTYEFENMVSSPQP